MTITSEQVGQSVAENLRTILAEESGEIIAVGFDEDATRELVDSALHVQRYHPFEPSEPSE
jgi:hypothetical protein